MPSTDFDENLNVQKPASICFNDLMPFHFHGPQMEDSHNLCTLKTLDEETLLRTLRERYLASRIFTHSGLMLISINPYSETHLFSDEIAKLYRSNDHSNLPPHIFSVLEQCLQDKEISGEHTIIINGDSGAGKTMCARYMLKYLGVPALSEAECILESLGNCKTLLNDNSSRFGKLIRLGNTIKIETYLLERSRVTKCLSGERNFHIFYYILANRRESLSNDYIDFDLGAIESKCHESVYSFTSLNMLLESYNNLKASFDTFQIDFEEIENILLGILYLGSIKVIDGEIQRDDKYNEATRLLRVGLDSLLLVKVLRVNNEEIHKKLSGQESYIIRNSLARQLYDCVFHYVLERINSKLGECTSTVDNLNILDIFGFENFNENNGLDQFCINWCNECIHDHFVKETFENQKNILISEGVCSEELLNGDLSLYKIESRALDLIQKRTGVADLIVEECVINGTSENLGVKLSNYHGLKIKPRNRLVFKHFNGEVEYLLDDFIDKNNEKCSLDELKVLNDGIKHMVNTQYYKNMRSTQSVVQTYRKSLEALMDVVRCTNVKYIKCIKPNNNKEAFKFEKDLVHKQLKSGGILESIHLSKHLFPYVLERSEFMERYPFSDLTEKYLTKGRTKIFFNNRGLNALEKERKAYIQRISSRIKALVQVIVAKKSTPRKDLQGSFVDQMRRCEKEHHRAMQFMESEMISDMNDVGCMLSDVTQGNVSRDPSNLKTLKDENSKLKNIVADLKSELELLKEISASSSRSINTESLMGEYQENESSSDDLEKLIRTFDNLSSTENENILDTPALHEVFRLLIHTFVSEIPAYSDTLYSKQKLFEFAHAIYHAICLSIVDPVKVLISELDNHKTFFQGNLAHAIYVLSNLVELRSMFKESEKSIAQDTFEELNMMISKTLKNVADLIVDSLSGILPHAILDYEPLKQSTGVTKLFAMLSIDKLARCSIDRLVQHLEYFHAVCDYFYLPPSLKQSMIAFALSTIDHRTFNSLLQKKKFLDFNKCYQIQPG